MTALEHLYDYGEAPLDDSLRYLEELGLLTRRNDRQVITQSWIRLTGRLKCVKADMLNALRGYRPPLLEALLNSVYRNAQVMAERGDAAALYDFVDALPRFAARLLPISPKATNSPPGRGKGWVADVSDTSAVNNPPQPLPGGELTATAPPAELQTIFNTPYPSYAAIMHLLQNMQLLEDMPDPVCPPPGHTPDELWRPGRKISSDIQLAPLPGKPQFTLTPYHCPHPKADVQMLLSAPWKMFVVQLGLVMAGYAEIRRDVIALRPEQDADPFTPQPVLVSLFDAAGRETDYGTLNQFVYDLCAAQGMALFPDAPPDAQHELFALLHAGIFTCRNNEYTLDDDFGLRVFREEFLLKNRARNLRKRIKSFIEKCQNL